MAQEQATTATYEDRDAAERRREPVGKRVRRALLIVLGILVWLAVSSVGGPLVGRLSEVQTNDNASFLPKSAESTEVNALARKFTSQESVPYFVVLQRDGGLTAQDRAFVASLTRKAAGLQLQPGTTYPLSRYLTPAPVVAVPSQDGEAVLAVVNLRSKAVTDVLPDGQTVLYDAAVALRSAAQDGAPPGLTSHVTGPGGIFADFVIAFSGIDGKLLGVALLAVFVILLLVYRSPVLPFAVLLTSLFGLSAAALAVFPLAKAGVITVNGQAQGILFILVVGAATDYSLLLVARYREELHDHPSKYVAMRRAWRAAIEPIAASAATVVLGLLCLLLSQLGSTKGLGPVGAIGIVGAFLSAVTFLPLLLLAGRWMFWPRIPHVDHVHKEDSVGRAGLWGRVAGLVGRHPRRVWVTTAVARAALAAFVPTFPASGVSQTDTFRTKVDSVVGQRVLAQHFPAGSGSPVVVIAPQDKASDVLRVAKGVEGVSRATVTPVDPRQPSTPKVVDGLVQVEAVLAPAADSPQGEAVVKRLRSAMDQVGPDVLVGGTTAINLDVREASIRDLRVIIPVILLVIFVVLALLLRSLVAPMLLIAANVLSFAATIGASALVFNHVLHLPGGDPAIPLYGFVFLVALGIDYSIFLMTRVREESGKRGTRPGILVGLAVTGGVITSAGVVLAATFGALATLPLLFLLQIAFIVAFGVLLDTLVVRSLLVPALAYDIGRPIWKPSRLARGEP